MTRLIGVCLICASALGSAGVGLAVAAESLGEAAKREKERRSKITPDRPAKSYGQADLAALEGGRGANTGESSPSSGRESQTTGSVPGTSTLGQQSPAGSREEYWRERAQTVRQAVQDAEDRVNVLETQYAQVPAMFRGPAIPCGGPASCRVMYRALELAAELQRAELALKRARQGESDLEDEARRAGALPGWLR